MHQRLVSLITLLGIILCCENQLPAQNPIFIGGNLGFSKSQNSERDFSPRQFNLEALVGIQRFKNVSFGIGLNYEFRHLNSHGTSDSQSLGIFPFVRLSKEISDRASLYIESRSQITGRDYHGGKIKIDEVIFNLSAHPGFQYRLSDNFTLLGRWGRLSYLTNLFSNSAFRSLNLDFAPAWFSFDANYYF